MRLGARSRIFLARHRWIYWATLAALAAGVGVTFEARLSALDAARSQWTTTNTVFVAHHDHVPDDPLQVDAVDLPLAAIPTNAVTERPDGVLARQHVGRGEVIVTDDILAAHGPASRAPEGMVVVGVVDALGSSPPVGIAVRVAAEGLLLASDATVVAVAGDVVYLAVSEDVGAMVAHAAHTGTASILFVP